jgi:hypothetical protein
VEEGTGLAPVKQVPGYSKHVPNYTIHFYTNQYLEVHKVIIDTMLEYPCDGELTTSEESSSAISWLKSFPVIVSTGLN